jgi:glutathione S-transferase
VTPVYRLAVAAARRVSAASERMGPPVQVIGSFLSPYVRKVLVALDLKGVSYEIDPIVPFLGGEEFSRLSPLRRIPVLIDQHVTLPDSTVICEYLDERYPDPPLLPAAAAERARARWLEEFADTRLGEVLIWRLFNQLVIRRYVWGEETDHAVVEHARNVEIPQALDYLEPWAPAEGWLFGLFSIADIAIAAFFRNAAFAGFAIDAERWPRTAGFVARILDHPSFAKLRPYEELSLRTPMAKQREALAAAGAPIARTSYGTATARRGIMSI